MINKKTESLLRSLFAKDEEGNLYVRIVAEEPIGLKNAVNTQSNLSLDGLLSGCVVLDEDNNPALRLAGVKYGKTIKEADDERRKIMLANKTASLSEGE